MHYFVSIFLLFIKKTVKKDQKDKLMLNCLEIYKWIPNI